MRSLLAAAVLRMLGLCVLVILVPIAASAADNGAAEFAKGWDFLKAKKYKEARAALEAGIKKNPANALAQFYLADACRGLKDWACAEEHYETSLELDPKLSTADLAKTRLKKAKVWRLLDEAKGIIVEKDVPPEKVQSAQDTLDIADKLGLDDEQQAVYQQLLEKISQRTASLPLGAGKEVKDQKDIEVADDAPSLKDTLNYIVQHTVNKARLAVPWRGVEPKIVSAVSIDQDRVVISYDDGREAKINFLEVNEILYEQAKEYSVFGGISKGDHLIVFSCKEGSKCAAYQPLFSSGVARIIFDSQYEAKNTIKALQHLMDLIQRQPRAPSPFEVSRTPSQSVSRGGDEAPMVLVPAGEFTMGSNQGEDDKKPAHLVHLDAFQMDMFEVTVEMYAKFLQATGSNAPPDWQVMNQPPHQKRPVVKMDWSDANTYCRWAGKRLPTEAEWEKAARGTDGRLYPWGNDPPEQLRANYGKTQWNDHQALVRVGTLHDGQSPYGIYDMAGNVWEWTSDWYDKDFYKNSPSRNPKGPESGESKVLRGGSWGNAPQNLRSALRNDRKPTSRFPNDGFRCAKTP